MSPGCRLLALSTLDVSTGCDGPAEDAGRPVHVMQPLVDVGGGMRLPQPGRLSRSPPPVGAQAVADQPLSGGRASAARRRRRRRRAGRFQSLGLTTRECNRRRYQAMSLARKRRSARNEGVHEPAQAAPTRRWAVRFNRSGQAGGTREACRRKVASTSRSMWRVDAG